jgi:hypothetical protein
MLCERSDDVDWPCSCVYFQLFSHFILAQVMGQILQTILSKQAVGGEDVAQGSVDGRGLEHEAPILVE